MIMNKIALSFLLCVDNCRLFPLLLNASCYIFLQIDYEGALAFFHIFVYNFSLD